ncbi:MAG TPA: sigma 54-interacting transcriptional regulator [Verrucomicrobiae bacterium]|nr:sigma 54-interacting transcriptional regulator [Verrucomicrobiae bacterium]
MYHLGDIKSTVQQTAEAIAAALKLEVEIADANLVRVAGTGQYRSRCGHAMEEGFVYRHVLQTGEPVIIDNPGFNRLCQPCVCRGKCLEYAEVAMPIRVNDLIIGVIGLISFDETQTLRLMDNKDTLLLFLEKMADLLVGKVVEDEHYRQRELLTNKLFAVLNSLQDGFLLADEQQNVTHFNTLAAKMLDINEEQCAGLEELIDAKKLWHSIEKGEQFSGQIKGRRVANQLFCDAVPIKKKGRIEGAVITLKDIQQIKNLVKDVSVSEVETNFSQIVGVGRKIHELKKMALKLAPGNSTILIQGESGTGKELLARAIHQSSKRKANGFIALNCGAIPETLLESELFGYEEGSFTGAKRGGKLGKFELAHNGTIFLDEIGDMPLHLQVKLLRVLQERRVERIGGTRSIPVDVRVIAATHRDLDKMVKTGEFREDLYYRLNVIPLTVPPLRERREDIPTLIEFYLQHYCELVEKQVKFITNEVMDILIGYPWPGNVRELANVIEYCVTMAVTDSITADILPERIKGQPHTAGDARTLNIQELERDAITRALAIASARGRKEDAAQLLGLSRATLFRKIKEYGISEAKTFS